MSDSEYLEFDTPEAAASLASITTPDTKIEPGQYPAKVASVRTFGRNDTLWLEVVFALPCGESIDAIIAPIASTRASQHADRVVEGLRLIKNLYGCELRQPPADLKTRNLTSFCGMPVKLTVAVTEKDGAMRAVVREFSFRSAKD
jgi:hypothetical protein